MQIQSHYLHHFGAKKLTQHVMTARLRFVQNRRPYYLRLLREELAKRKQKNPQFSLRAFASKIGIDNGALSNILNEKRTLSLKLGQKILNKLDCTPQEEELFLVSIVQAQSKRPLKRRDPQVRLLQKNALQKTTFVLDQSIYQNISEWYHAAILELSYRDDFVNDPHYISQILGISVHDAKSALERLFDLELLVVEDGKVVKRDQHLDGNNQRHTTKALRRKQKQIREKAIEAIDNQDPARRYMTTVTMCIDPDLLEEAKKRIDDFNDSLCAFLESGKRKEVYTMEIGLFSLEQNREKNRELNREKSSNKEQTKVKEEAKGTNYEN
jgi:uncharacterized protein (TIGR02147 family)